LLSPMLRPFSARSGSDSYGPRFCSPPLYCRNLSPQPGLFGPVSGRQSAGLSTVSPCLRQRRCSAAAPS
jgi:hypothetical protein